jgi:hypothetical protein
MSWANSKIDIQSRKWRSTRSIRRPLGAEQETVSDGNFQSRRISSEAYQICSQAKQRALTQCQLIHVLQHIAKSHQGDDAVVDFVQNSLVVRGRDISDDDLTDIDACVGIVGRGAVDFGIGEHLFHCRVGKAGKCGHGVEMWLESEDFGI